MQWLIKNLKNILQLLIFSNVFIKSQISLNTEKKSNFEEIEQCECSIL